jgi:Kef-type K+ transport system membrane component KefB
MATLGLTGGLLTQTLFTVIILMAVATTIITPLLLRFTLTNEAAANLTNSTNYPEPAQETI